MINKHQTSSLQTLPKYNGQHVCDYDQKCHFATNIGVMTMKCTRYVLINVTTLKNDQEHLKHIQ